ncbi:MAG: hypothetical protein JNL90_20065 [Planctomycetes bacterium]|nr:hypothetical protein [Planctomycetota bacterium]
MATSSGIGRAVWLASGGLGLAVAGFVAGRLSMSSARLGAPVTLGAQQQADEAMPPPAAPATVESDDLVLAGVTRDAVVAPPMVEPAAEESQPSVALDAVTLQLREFERRSAVREFAELVIPNPITNRSGSKPPADEPQLTAGEVAAIEAVLEESRTRFEDCHVEWQNLVDELFAEKEKLRNERPVSAAHGAVERSRVEDPTQRLVSKYVSNRDGTYELHIQRGDSARLDELRDLEEQIRSDARRRLADLLASFDR